MKVRSRLPLVVVCAALSGLVQAQTATAPGQTKVYTSYQGLFERAK